MPSGPTSIPEALSRLERALVGGDAAGLKMALQALQRLGLSQSTLRLHVERLRAENDVTAQDDAVEEAALSALDLIQGSGLAGGLEWGAAELAAIHLPRSLTEEDFRGGAIYAFAPNDLLPPRLAEAPTPEAFKRVVNDQYASLLAGEGHPEEADFFPVPKGAFTTRRAALLAPSDRLIFEALVNRVASDVNRLLPAQVVWPRTREDPPVYSAFAETPLGWGCKYIVRADIQNFFESIPHDRLAYGLASRAHLPEAYQLALESFLTAVMGSVYGLPQGPVGSDLLASAYLADIDDSLAETGWDFLRYADDYFVGAGSLADGRAKLSFIEARLSGIGLNLNGSKSRVLRADTYQQGLEERPFGRGFRERIRLIAESDRQPSEHDEDFEDVLRDVSRLQVDLWSNVYHGEFRADDLLREARQRLPPSILRSYAEYFRSEIGVMARGEEVPNEAKLESELAECLIFMAAGGEVATSDELVVAVAWFPKIAPYVSAYLEAVSEREPAAVADVLKRTLSDSAQMDWVRAWLCAVCEGEPHLVNQGLAETLHSLTREVDTGALTRAVASRALWRAGLLDAETLRHVLNVSTPALRLELALALPIATLLPEQPQPPFLDPGPLGLPDELHEGG